MIKYFTKEDWDACEVKENAGEHVDWDVYAFSVDYDGDVYTVRVADMYGPNERPVLDENNAITDGERSFDTQDAMHKYMCMHGFTHTA